MNALRGFTIDPALTGGVTVLPPSPLGMMPLGRADAAGAPLSGPWAAPAGRADAAWAAAPGPFTQPASASSDDPAQRIVGGLMARGIPETAAIGIAANLGAESRFDSGINEIAPVVRGSRGGFGLAQWTGPRRRQLEAFAAQRGLPVSDEGLQLDFLAHEMQGSERGNVRDTLAAATPEQAAYEFMDDFLRPGVANGDHRMSLARQIAGGEATPYAAATPRSGTDHAGTGTPSSDPARPRTGAFAGMAGMLAAGDTAMTPSGRSVLDVRAPLVEAPALPSGPASTRNALAGYVSPFDTLREAFA